MENKGWIVLSLETEKDSEVAVGLMEAMLEAKQVQEASRTDPIMQALIAAKDRLMEELDGETTDVEDDSYLNNLRRALRMRERELRAQPHATEPLPEGMMVGGKTLHE